MSMAPTLPARLHLDAVLTPHRSLSKRGFVILLIVLAVYNLLVAGFLLAIGAFPVPVFLGLDFLAVFVAFRVSYRRARTTERVQVTADQVRVLYEGRGKPRTVWTSPTAFTRVEVDQRGEHEARVHLRLSRRGLIIGDGLGPDARTAFAAQLEAAILSARAERHAG
jgi:uncharacterized membrane protein